MPHVSDNTAAVVGRNKRQRAVAHGPTGEDGQEKLAHVETEAARGEQEQGRGTWRWGNSRNK